MAVEHNNLTDPELHEPKGVASASEGQLYIADGAGGGVWDYYSPYGNTHYTDLAAASTVSLTTSYAVMNDAAMSQSFSSDQTHEFTHSGGRLTYTGASDRHFHIVTDWSIDHTAGVDRDISMSVYKNGVLIDHAESIQTTASGNKVSGTIHADIDLSTNDYIEIYSKGSASLTLNIYNIYLFLVGMPHHV